MTFEGESVDIPANATNTDVEVALEGVSTLNNVSVANTDSNGFRVRFRGSRLFEDVELMQAASTLTDGGGAPVNVSIAAVRSGSTTTSSSATFELPGFTPVVELDDQDQVIHPLWRHLYSQDDPGNASAPVEQAGHDIAVVRLEDGAIAPLDAQRYELYENTDEVGQTFRIVGYGMTGTGATGANQPSVQKRLGYNTFGEVDPVVGSLVSDFDDPENPSAGPGLGELEAAIGPGDSGGPVFLPGLVEGNPPLQIAGVNSATLGGGHGNFRGIQSLHPCIRLCTVG